RPTSTTSPSPNAERPVALTRRPVRHRPTPPPPPPPQWPQRASLPPAEAGTALDRTWPGNPAPTTRAAGRTSPHSGPTPSLWCTRQGAGRLLRGVSCARVLPIAVGVSLTFAQRQATAPRPSPRRT